jgi:hypothetical protein
LLASPLEVHVASFQTQIQTVSFFYSAYLTPKLSVSIVGGPQHYQSSQSSVANAQGWAPSGGASLGWQARHTNVAANYSRTVTAGAGLLGVYNGNFVSVSVRQQLTRNWIAVVSGGYSIYKSPRVTFSNRGGHAVLGTAAIERKLGTHISAELAYSRIHQSFAAIPVVSTFPDVNREWISISYQFTRPLGR